MGVEKQGSKPSGKQGIFMGKMMNRFHTSFYIKYFKNKDLPEKCRILDIGCGGGKFIQYMSQKGKGFLLYGLDHSKEMIELSGKVNKETVQQGRVKLMVGSVSSIGLQNNSVDLVTAFETVQFWSDIEKAFSEVFRALDTKGEFLIINRFPKEGSKWWKMAKLKSEQDFKNQLEKAGFKDVSFDFKFKKGWVVVMGIKE